MSRKFAFILISCLLVFVGYEGMAQNARLEYSNNITISDGLAHNGVTSMIEDSEGFLWFGTYDGLTRYDGYELEVFKNTIDENLLVSNRVRSLIEDFNNNLWIGTDEGITIYKTSEGQFESIYSNRLKEKGKRGPIIRQILINEENKTVLCATEGDGVIIFDKQYNFIGQFFPSGELFNSSVSFYDGIQLDSDNFLFTTSTGLVLFNTKFKEFNKVDAGGVTFANSVTQLDGRNLLITLLSGVGIFEYQKNAKSYTFKLKETGLLSYKFKTSLLDDLNNLWLGTLNDGVIKLEDFDLSAGEKTFEKPNLKYLNDNLRISSIDETSTRNIWVSTFNDGAFQFNLYKNPFNFYNTEKGYEYGIGKNFINFISPLNNDRALMTANFGSIAMFNIASEKFEPIPFNITKEEAAITSSVFVDSKENIWMSRMDEPGFFRVRKNSKKVERVPFDDFLEITNIIPRSFTEDNYGNLWVGAIGGLFKFSLDEENNIVNIESINQHSFFKDIKLSLVRYVYADPRQDFIWVGTGSMGLFRIQLKNKNSSIEELKISQFLHDNDNPNSISSNFVTSIVRQPNNDLWVGTEGGGFSKVENSVGKPKFKAFTEKHGLSNNVVKSIVYDNRENLWVSTNIGLNKFNPKNKIFRVFNEEDGLLFEDFWYASAKMKNGQILLSGLDGVCYFDPEDQKIKEPLPRLHFEDLRIFNDPVHIHDTINGRQILDQRLNNIKELQLKYNENVFSIQLTSLHYSNPANHHLKYKLSPINEEWLKVPSDQKNVYYNGLPPGEYTLIAKASNSFGEYTAPRKLQIIISPPFWKTYYAYFLYFILIIAIVYGIFHFILRLEKLNHSIQIKQLEKDNEKAVNDAKLRFFSNISHEIKTPITLISGPIGILRDRFSGHREIESNLEMVQRQSKKIEQLVDQVHDFQRAESNELKMNFSRFSFNKFIKELITDFKFLANKDGKDLKLETGNSKITVAADKDKLEKILNNLLSNALKYTNKGDCIKVSFKSEDKDLIVIVKDTGLGITKEDLPRVFDRFFQSRNKESKYIGGSGIGLAFSKKLVEMHYGYIDIDSEINEGTSISVRLPIVKEKSLLDEEKAEKDILSEEHNYVGPNIITSSTKELSKINIIGDFSDSIIFYVEDNPDMRTFVSGILKKFFQVKEFSNGKECLEAMKDQWPDIIVSDLLMPEINGLGLCKSIKSDIKTSHIPFILLTACTTKEEQIQGIRDGADAYIRKPFNVQRLLTNIEALLQNRRQLRERFEIGLPLTKDNNKNNRNDNAFIEKLYNLMAENLDNQDLDMDQFAQDLYLNRTHFYQKVKALTNHTPFELLKMYRLKKAAELLLKNDLTISEVHSMTGFKSRTHFSKLFKEKYEVTPGKYAAHMHKKHY